MKITLPIKVISESNQREHWAKKHRRKKLQQREFYYLWRKAKPEKITLPATIIFTRHASRLLDTDNLAGAFKFLQDSLAKEIGVDDGSELIEWKYEQVKLNRREYFITVEIINENIGKQIGRL